MYKFFGTKENDPLIKFKSPIFGNFFNGWTLTHFIFFYYLGYYYPDCTVEASVLGLLWEIIEHVVGEYLPIINPKLAFSIDPFWTSWYYGCWEDLVMNTLGFYIGRHMSKR